MAAIANLQIDQGATFTSDVTVKDANGNAFDLTGYTAKSEVSKGLSIHEDPTRFYNDQLDAATGVVTLSLTATQTAALEDTRYVYDLEIVTGDVVTRVIEGLSLLDHRLLLNSNSFCYKYRKEGKINA